ncbi:MAG: CRISPR-associated endonuclease Cas2 [Candidatus Hatepunaea meridiana]|nr:CRISPR-associated endonuclease Cas2 [Candidatus Hatepunaea meridiana]
MNYLICYDISNDKKRTKLAKMLDNYGDRVQESVFELPRLDREIFDRCLSKLKKFKIDEEDSIRIYPLCESCKKGIILFGVGTAMEVPDVYIV